MSASMEIYKLMSHEKFPYIQIGSGLDAVVLIYSIVL
jgi:hypothetical protein